MGIPFSCSYGGLDDLDKRFEAFLVRSMSFDGDDEGSTLRSLSFNGRDSEPAAMKSFGSGKMLFKGSLSFKGRDIETLISFRPPEETKMVRNPSHMSRETGEPLPTDSVSEKATRGGPLWETGYKRFQAALRLQKVYKSFRTRRQLADCAVLVEQRWWKLLDFAELKRSSISFFDIENPETAFSRWSRARTRAAKVGKGLSKDERARKLALQHWLEAIDPRHRYGHNLQFYYCKWLHCESKQPFFYWLDIGEGKEVNLDRCPRSKLLQQCIRYLGPKERREYEVAVNDGKFFYKLTGKLLDTREGPPDAKWIFVLSVSKNLYIGQKHKGTFQHSSFLAGGATLSAGRLVVEDGILKAVWPHSGHYLPTEENFEEFMSFLKEHRVDLSIVQRSPTDEEEGGLSKKRSELTVDSAAEEVEKVDSNTEDSNIGEPKHLPLEIPGNLKVIKLVKEEDCGAETPTDGYETADEELSDEDFEVSKLNLFDEDLDSDYEEAISQEKIMQRINSHKGMKSYQLAHRLSCKWTTGAGPRIGCVRDYPTELQNRALEEVNLSPRSNFSTPRRLFRPSPLAVTPTSLCRESTAFSRSPLAVAAAAEIATP